MKNTIQIKSEKYWLYLIVWLLTCLIIKNNPIETELFVRERKLNISFVFNT